MTYIVTPSNESIATNHLSENSKYVEHRRFGRATLRVPVKVSGTSADGTALEEDSFTGVVGELGAMIRTSRLLRMGSEVEVTNRFSQQTARFRVVWVKERQEDNLWVTGIESLSPVEEFWGVRFPPKSGTG